MHTTVHNVCPPPPLPFAPLESCAPTRLPAHSREGWSSGVVEYRLCLVLYSLTHHFATPPLQLLGAGSPTTERGCPCNHPGNRDCRRAPPRSGGLWSSEGLDPKQGGVPPFEGPLLHPRYSPPWGGGGAPPARGALGKLWTGAPRARAARARRARHARAHMWKNARRARLYI